MLENEQNSLIDWKKYFHVFMKRKWSIIFLGLLGGIWGAFIALSTIPVYSSTALLVIDRNARENVVAIRDLYQRDNDRRNFHNTQKEILFSHSIAQRVIDQLNLQDRWGTTVTNNDSLVSDIQPTIRELARKWVLSIRGIKSPEQVELDPETVRSERLIRRLLYSLRVEIVKNSKVFKISYSHTDRILAADIANAIAKAYIDNDMESRLQLSGQATGWLADKLENLLKKLQASEVALQAYREEEKLIDVGGVTGLSGTQLEDLSQKKRSALQKRLSMQAEMAQVKKAKKTGRLAELPVVLADSVIGSLQQKVSEQRLILEGLSNRYGDKHPKLIQAKVSYNEARQAVSRRISQVISGLEKNYYLAIAQEKEVLKQLGAAKNDLQTINRKSSRHEELERDVSSNRQLYELFLKRFKETKETSSLVKTHAKIINPAVPSISSMAVDLNRYILIGFILGLGLGLAIIFLLHRLDNTLKYPSDIKDNLSVPLLGVLPALDLKAKADTLEYVKKHSDSVFSEAIRSIRTGILLSGLDSESKVILVTSSVPSEGKSTLSNTLANSLGDLKRVLLIDADMRRPSVGESWGIQKDVAGLSEYVSKISPLGECVHKQGESHVYVMPSGAIPPNPLELLSSKRFKEVIVSLQEKFDYIVIDSAPVLAVSDALVISTLVTGVVYVSKAASTSIPNIEDGLVRLEKVSAPLVGLVLNNALEEHRAAYGYYGNEYYGGYSKASPNVG